MHQGSTRIGRPGKFAILAFIVISLSSLSLAAASTTLVHFGSPWRYHDFGEFPGANWFTAAFADGDWNFNFSEFGYGDGDEQTVTSPALTTYFRMFLTITNPQD